MSKIKYIIKSTYLDLYVQILYIYGCKYLIEMVAVKITKI